MDSPLPTPLPLSTEDLHRTFDGYRQALSFLPPAQLMAELNRVSALLQDQSNSLLTGTLWQASHSEIDRLGPAEEPLSMSQSEAGRDRPTSPRSSPPTSSISLLAGTGRLGPRLAAKLIVSSARAQSYRTGR
jgi:hypothetical protein